MRYYLRLIRSIILVIAIRTIPLPAVVINEIMPNPATGGEWIELFNEAEEVVNLKDWRIIDAAGNEALLISIDKEITPDEYLIIAEDSVTADLLEIEPFIQLIIPESWATLNNDGDHLRLANEMGGTMDEIEYGSDAGKVAGRSWERIDVTVSGLDINNWGPCADLNGHTAGRQNSLTQVQPGMALSVRVEPNPFNPYQGEETRIYFNLPAAVARISVEVYNLTGRIVRRLASNIPAGSHNPSLKWNGRSDDGSLMPIGRYIIYIEAVDSRGGKVHSAKCTVVLADRLK